MVWRNWQQEKGEEEIKLKETYKWGVWGGLMAVFEFILTSDVSWSLLCCSSCWAWRNSASCLSALSKISPPFRREQEVLEVRSGRRGKVGKVPGTGTGTGGRTEVAT